MPTGDEFVKLSLKRFLSQNRLDANLLDFVRDEYLDVASRIFPSSGLFTFPATITPNYGADTFTVTPATIAGIDNAGHVCILTGTDLVDISYEDVANDDYWIGMKYIEIPSGVYNNPRTGQVEYDKIKASVGELGVPDSATDLGVTIELNVNTLFQDGGDHSGRVVKVWLNNPMSDDALVAFEDCVVAYAAGDNTITTAGSLGQSSISATASDYAVACLGLTVYNNGAHAVIPVSPFGDEYILLGVIEGATGVTDSSLQLDLSGGGGHSLQKAYDGLSGSGSGRIITADDGAVEINQQSTSLFSSDVGMAALRITKDDNTSVPNLVAPFDPEDVEVGIDVKTRLFDYAAVLNRVNLLDVTANGFLESEESIDILAASNTLTFTRAGVDLEFTGLTAYLLPQIDLVEIKDSSNGNDGLYLIATIPGADTLTVYGLDFSIPALVIESGTSMIAKLYRPYCRVGASYTNAGVRVNGLQDFADDDGVSPYNFYSLIPPTVADAKLHMRCYRDGAPASILDINANADLDTTGDITTSLGDIEATAGAVISSAAHGFEYKTTRSFYMLIPVSAGISEINGGTSLPLWEITTWGGPPSTDMAVRSLAAGKIHFAIRVPPGMVIKAWEASVKDAGGATTVEGSIYRNNITWATGASSVTVSDADTSGGAGAVEVIGDAAVNLGGAGTDTTVYSLVFESQGSGCFVYGIRLTLEADELTP